MVDVNELIDASPWHPMTNSVDLKHLGKLNEELAEAIAASSRCTIQGIDECEPVTGKINRKWLEDELADAIANIELVISHFSLDATRINTRIEKKKKHLSSWHKMA